MKNKKRIISSILISIVILFGLAGCGTNKSDLNSNSSSAEQSDNYNPTNLTSKLDISNVNDLETQIVSTSEYISKTSLCVMNYQTVISYTYHGPFSPSTQTTSKELYSIGSGVIYYKGLNEDNTYTYRLITNEHVVSVEDSTSVIAGGESYEVYDGENSIKATLLGKDEKTDLAVLSFVSSNSYTAITFANEEATKVGKFVLAIGTPIDIKYYNTVSFGIISKITTESIQHDAIINSGNSGGGLFNIYGELIGINNAKLSGSTTSGTDIEGIGFAIRESIIEATVLAITGTNDIVYS